MATTAVSSLSSNTFDNSKQRMYGVPVKFADDLFSTLVKDQINHLINLSELKGLQLSDEDSIRSLTNEIIELIKRIVYQHIKDNYKVIIQVITYPKENESNTFITSKCLWNYRTDDVLSLEIESNLLKFFIVIHGVVA